jgi:hypothetical protein
MTTPFLAALERANKRTREREEAQAALDRAVDREHRAKVLADPKPYLKKQKAAMKLRQKNLLDPNWDHVRFYPKFSMGDTTRGYIRTYQALNRKTSNAPELTFTHADRLAPMNLPWESGL